MDTRKNGGFFFLPAGDFLLVVGVFVFGYWIRHFALAGFLEEYLGIPNDFRLGLSNYVISGIVMACVELLMFRAFNVYRRESGVTSVEELSWILRVTFTAVVITFAFTFASRQLMFSRFVLAFAFPTASLAIYMWHNTFNRIYSNWAKNRGTGPKVVVYGTGKHAWEISEYIRSGSAVPYRFLGFVTVTEKERDPETLRFDSPDEMFRWLSENRIDELILADPGLSREETAEMIYGCEKENLSYKVMADVSDLVTMTTRVTNLGGITMIESVPPPLSGSSMLLKRIFDLALAVPMAALLLPLGLLVALAIVADSGFPVFYVQTRLGKSHRSFRLLKFRSMKVGADTMEKPATGNGRDLLAKPRNDPRITRVGKFLRKFSLDELPQLFNVISGSMSLVGPRPHVPEEVRRYSLRHFKKLEVPPGMTGVCQVSGRNDLSYDEMVKLDLYYVDNWSIWLDISILIMTIPAILFRRGAY